MKLDNLLTRLGVAFLREGNHHCRRGWVQTDCPYCGMNSGRFHMGWNLSYNYVNCWKCGGHPLDETLGILTRQPIGKLRQLLEQLDKSVAVSEVEGLRTGTVKIPKGVTDLQPAHKKYLKRRHLCPDELSRLWNVQGFGLHSRLSWRLFIPIQLHGETVSWTTRAIHDRGVRYMSASAEEEAMNHKRLLYGEDYVKHAVIVHEGPFDVWRTGPGAVALCGTGFTRAQVLRLTKYPIRVVCFDMEYEAQKRAAKLVDMLAAFPGETYHAMLTAKDAAEAGDEEIKELRRFLK